MDLRLPVTYRTFNFTDAVFGPGNKPIKGCDLRRIQYGDVQGEGYREKRALDDGYDAGSVWLGFRPIEMSGTLYGDTLENLWDSLQSMRRALTPTLAYADAPGDLGFLPFMFTQRTGVTADWADGTMELMMLARPSAQPRFVVEQARLAGKVGEGFAIEFSAQLWCRDPRIYVQIPAGKSGSQEKLITGTGGTTAGAGTFTNRGDYPAPLDIILYASAGGSARTFRFWGIGTDFTVVIPVSSNPRIVRVDSTLKVVTYQEETASGVSSETLRMDLISFETGFTWPKVPTSGTMTYTWSCTGDGVQTGSKIFFSEAYA